MAPLNIIFGIFGYDNVDSGVKDALKQEKKKDYESSLHCIFCVLHLFILSI